MITTAAGCVEVTLGGLQIPVVTIFHKGDDIGLFGLNLVAVNDNVHATKVIGLGCTHSNGGAILGGVDQDDVVAIGESGYIGYQVKNRACGLGNDHGIGGGSLIAVEVTFGRSDSLDGGGLSQVDGSAVVLELAVVEGVLDGCRPA